MSQTEFISVDSVDMSVELAGVRLKNPLLTASGTCGYGLEYAPYVDLAQLGAFTTKSITPEVRKGNPPERIVETSSGMLNAIGLANVGWQRFLTEKVPQLPQLGVPIFVNVAGHRLEDYLTVCRAIDPLPEIAGIELNVSCPNVADGLTFGTNPQLLEQLVAEVRKELARCILIVKLSPNVTDICQMARAAISGGAQVLSMVNTFSGMAINIKSWRPMLANNSGGLSGPAIKPLAIYQIHQVYSKVAKAAGVPIIGMGGIRTWEDAVEFALAGATALAVGTQLFIDPGTPLRIVEELRIYLAEKGLGRFNDLVGRLQLHSV
ncbi:MAG: Dihydroorotate dehydrogenase B (NAD(+)), catalytic subunit [Phycisphaerae bacterium]|nr:Dihydroorotate dehydrogenase B (NAD(+)), catalytic subunit [Phycisphaerae bacterium]